MKKDVHIYVDYEVWKAYKRLCANITPNEDYASRRIEKFMERELKRKRKNEKRRSD